MLKTIRNISVSECPWLLADVPQGTEATIFNGGTYGCITSSGVAVNLEGIQGFVELPMDALAAVNYLVIGHNDAYVSTYWFKDKALAESHAESRRGKEAVCQEVLGDLVGVTFHDKESMWELLEDKEIDDPEGHTINVADNSEFQVVVTGLSEVVFQGKLEKLEEFIQEIT